MDTMTDQTAGEVHAVLSLPWAHMFEGTIPPDKRGIHILFFLFLHENTLWVLIRSASSRHF